MVLLDTGTPGTSREIVSEDADDGTRTRNPSITNRVLYSIQEKYKIVYNFKTIEYFFLLINLKINASILVFGMIIYG